MEPLKDLSEDTKAEAKNSFVKLFDDSLKLFEQSQKLIDESQKLLDKIIKGYDNDFEQLLYL
jgi:hypothetical protein